MSHLRAWRATTFLVALTVLALLSPWCAPLLVAFVLWLLVMGG